MAKYLLTNDFTDPLFTEAFKKYFSELGIAVREWDKLWAEMNDGETFAYLCVENDDEVIGFIQFSQNVMQNFFFEEKVGFIRELWVRENCRGCGYGSRLLSLAERYFLDRGITRCILTTDSAERFYVKHGYRRRINVRAANKDASFTKELTEFHALEACICDAQFISRIYRENRDILHGEDISDSEWEVFLKLSDEDERHFIIYCGSIPCAWLKVNGLLGNDGRGWISTLIVDKEKQGKGIGRFAVNFAEAFLHSKEKSSVGIYTTADNAKALRFYKNCGYCEEECVTELSDCEAIEYIRFAKYI